MRLSFGFGSTYETFHIRVKYMHANVFYFSIRVSLSRAADSLTAMVQLLPWVYVKRRILDQENAFWESELHEPVFRRQNSPKLPKF